MMSKPDFQDGNVASIFAVFGVTIVTNLIIHITLIGHMKI